MNEDRTLTDAGANLIKHFESCHCKAYKCPAGVLTIGWGHTNAQGEQFKAGETWEQYECDAAFWDDMIAYERAVRKAVTIRLEPWHFDALVSFTYNVGEGNLRKSTLLKKVNAGDFKGAAAEFQKWNKSGGKVMAGLTRRRASEALLFQNIRDKDYDGKADPTKVPAIEPMPQAVDDPG